MAHLITMPAVVADAEDAVLASWLVSIGDEVTQGQPLAEVETEKAMVELESTGSGAVARLLVDPGATVAVGTPVAGLLAAGEEDSAIDQLLADTGAHHDAAEPAPTSAELTTTPQPAPALDDELTTPEPSHARVFVSPIARKRAKQAGINLQELVGSGPNGRIIRTDVEAAIAAQETGPRSEATPGAPAPTAEPTKYREEKAAPMRKAIARRLSESKSTVPHFYLSVDVFMDQLLQMRADINTQLESTGLRLTVNDLLIKALAVSLQEVPEANATWHDDVIRYYNTVDIAVAVATDGGLLTPVVSGVEHRSLSSIAEGMHDIKVRSASGKIRQNELEGGTFTLSNLGMFGTREFSAIINPPHAGIIAVGTTEERVVALDSKPEVARVMTATLSADHRVVDGAVGARLMQTFKDVIEKPLRLLI